MSSSAHSRAVEPSSVLPRTAWQKVLSDTLVEVFSVMAGIEVTISSHEPIPSPHITGIVGIGGAIRAKLTLVCSDSFAAYLASQMLAIPPDHPGSQKAACDALGEICNIVAGYFKARVGLGDACMISVPTIINGRDYIVRSKNKDDIVDVAASHNQQALLASLEIAK